jgi:hypothetical protein
MALPDYFKIEPGTAVIWGEAGATGVTKTLSFDGLADGAARMGEYADLGAQFDEEYSVMLIIESGTAPTAGTRVDLYLVCTDSTARYPGGVTGSDGAWPADSNEDEWALQLGAPVVSLIATNDANTVQIQAPVIWRPAARYVVPVVDNNLGQAIRDETTATDNDSRIILVPRRLLVQDSA